MRRGLGTVILGAGLMLYSGQQAHADGQPYADARLPVLLREIPSPHPIEIAATAYQGKWQSDIEKELRRHDSWILDFVNNDYRSVGSADSLAAGNDRLDIAVLPADDALLLEQAGYHVTVMGNPEKRAILVPEPVTQEQALRRLNSLHDMLWQMTAESVMAQPGYAGPGAEEIADYLKEHGRDPYTLGLHHCLGSMIRRCFAMQTDSWEDMNFLDSFVMDGNRMFGKQTERCREAGILRRQGHSGKGIQRLLRYSTSLHTNDGHSFYWPEAEFRFNGELPVWGK